jgi:putative ABC transport system permease protein
MDSLIQDFRYAVRVLSRARAFTFAALLTLAAGIGATTAIFSVLYAVVLDPLPYRDSSRLAIVWETDRHNGSDSEAASLPDLRDWQAQTRSFSSLAGYRRGVATLTETGRDAERVDAGFVTWDLFPTLGVAPARGRGFTAKDDVRNAAPVALISDSLWRRRFAGADILDRSLDIDGKPHRIIGVMPEGFRYPRRSEVWVTTVSHAAEFMFNRGVHNTIVLGRLKPGVTGQAAQSEMTLLMTRLGKQYSDTAGRGARVEPLQDVLVGDVRPRIMLLTAAVSVVLLIGCINIAGLLLARSGARARELAIRASLGATRLRVVRQLFIESLVLAVSGALLGVGVAAWGTKLIVSMLPTLPRAAGIGLRPPVLLFAAGVAVLSALLFGLLPAFRAAAGGAFVNLRGRSDDASHSFGRSLLVVAEVALAVVLVVGAGLFLRSLNRLLSVDSGVRTEHVLSASIQLPAARYPVPGRKVYPHWPEAINFYAQLEGKLRATPGVRAAAIAATHPFDSGWTTTPEVEGQPPQPDAEHDEVRMRAIGPGYFETLGIPLLRGRTILDTDGPTSGDVLVVNEALERRYFPKGDAVGKRIRFWGHDRIIIGVVRGERFLGLDHDSDPAVYPPLTQVPQDGLTVLARVDGEPMAFANTLRAAVRGIDPTIAVAELAPVADKLSESTAVPRVQTTLVSIFGAMALLLAALGLYGLIAYQVQQRTHEIGIRVALGASKSAILRLILGRGLVLAVSGVAVGIVAALLTTRLVASSLYQVSASDPAVFAVVAGMLTAIALAASYFPARRAAQVQPAEALRYE